MSLPAASTPCCSIPHIEKSDKLKMSDWSKEMLARYGEYPDASGKIYALPINADAEGMHYRKDLFEDPKEKAGFKEKYGYELELPQTWKQLRDIAEWFTRPPELYGLGMMGGREYDYLTSVTNCLIWSFGGELWNPDTFEIKGYIDSPASIDGLKFYIELMKFCPPGVATWGWDEVNTAFQTGKVAMAHNWFYFFGAMADPKQNPYADRTGFAILPGAVGRDGMFRREFSMGGQGIGISKYSKNVQAAWDFIEWYEEKPQQKRYGAVCQTGRQDVLDDPNWLNANDIQQVVQGCVQIHQRLLASARVRNSARHSAGGKPQCHHRQENTGKGHGRLRGSPGKSAQKSRVYDQTHSQSGCAGYGMSKSVPARRKSFRFTFNKCS